jgi:hypothetical protein
MYKYSLLILSLALCAFNADAQKPDTTKSAGFKNSKDTLISTAQDTIAARSRKRKIKKEKVYHPDSSHSPRTAVIRSLLIPGSGQIYNHEWWKVPAVYAGLGTLTYFLIMNTDSTREYLQLALYRESGIPPGPKEKFYRQYKLYYKATDQSVYDAYNYYRRDRDLCILGILGFWAINIVDAYISAKFESVYTVDTNLSMKVEPFVLNQQMFAANINGSFIPGLKFTFAF